MALHLPKPYPDELLHSVLARHCRYIGLTKKYVASEHIFGAHVTFSIDVMKMLNHISHQTWDLWRLSGDEIAEKMTLYSFYTRYLSEDRSKTCLESMKKDTNKSMTPIKSLIGHIRADVGAPLYLKFCESCRDQNIKRYGETFWRRSHQLPGVYVCPEHGEELIEVSLGECRISSQMHYIDATDITLNEQYTKTYNIKGVLLERSIQVAKRCQAMLLGPIARWASTDIHVLYRLAALERGYGKDIQHVDYERINADFVNYYTPDLLKIMNCMSSGRNHINWIRRIFHTNLSHSFHPFQHALLQVFLESKKSEQVQIRSFGEGPWKCPNPYATHTNEFPIERVRVGRDTKGNLTASAVCCCGCKFSFAKVSDNDHSMPIVSKINKYAPSWRDEIERLLRFGMKQYEIANMMGIHKLTVRRLRLKTIQIDTESSCRMSIHDIHKMRLKWLKLIKRVPNHSRTVAATKDQMLYKNLLKYDRSWFLAGPRSRRRYFNSNKIDSVDWKKRDETWCKNLREAAIRLITSQQKYRLTMIRLIQDAKLPANIRSLPEKLPKCRRVLENYVESFESFQERRVNIVASQIIDKGQPISVYRFLELAGLHQKLKPRIRQVLIEVFNTTLNGLIFTRSDNAFRQDLTGY